MSGHSKWSTIKHKKEAKDQRRGQLFSRIARELTTAAAEGKSGDPEMNPRLRVLLEKAKAANMPSANISRAIERGLGGGGGPTSEEVAYEGYGPAGIAVIAVSHTDNRQRTSAEIRRMFEEAGGSLGGPGSAAFLFDRVGGGFQAKVLLPLHEQNAKEALNQFLNALGAHADITDVYSNAQLTE